MKRLLLLLLLGLSFLNRSADAQSRVSAWGWNSFGALGDGTTMDKSSPVTVKNSLGTGFLENVVAVAHGGNHGLALKEDGTVWAWGDNSQGQLGIGDRIPHTLPVQVRGEAGNGVLTGVVALACAGASSMALKSDGTLCAWGYNYFGQLGDGTTSVRLLPVAVIAESGTDRLRQVIAIAGGGGFYLGLKQNGSLLAWGSNSFGELGDGTLGTVYSRSRPAPVRASDGLDTLHNVVSFSCGELHALAVTTDGKAFAWGGNSRGQLGQGIAGAQPPDDTPSDLGLPTLVKSPDGTGILTDMAKVACGGFHSLALKRNGTVVSWGANEFGQLGDNTSDDRSLPAPVKNSIGTGVLTGIKELIAGERHSLALTQTRTAFAWGSNNRGQLGDGTMTDSFLPVQVLGLTQADCVAATYDSTLAISLPQATLSGHLDLGALDSLAPPQFVAFEFRPTDGAPIFTRFAAIDHTGNYTLDELCAEAYTVWIKGSKWLAVTVPADTTGGSATNVSASLLAGDLNGDNAVDFGDLSLMLQVYNTLVGDTLYLDSADLNSDGGIDFGDLSAMLQNYNVLGED